MLFTNDGELAHRLTHPRYDHPKTYRVLLEGSPSEATLDVWRRGVVIDSQRTRPADVEKIIKTRRGTLVEVRLWEGRKRQIRKVAAALGHPALELVRVGLGPLELGDLPTGAWRRLTDEEVAALRAIRQMRRRAPYGEAARRASAPRGDRRPGPRPERTGRGGQRERLGRTEGGFRGERDSERSDRPRWPRRPGEADREQPGRFPRPDERDRGRPPRSRPTGHSAPTGRTGRDERRSGDRDRARGPRRPEEPDRRERGRADRPPRSEGGDRPRRPIGPSRPGGAGRSQRPGKPARPGGGGQSRRPDRPPRGGDRPERPSSSRRPPRRGKDER
jgi:pseudouridine synthase